jgi:hypothetical protein
MIQIHSFWFRLVRVRVSNHMDQLLAIGQEHFGTCRAITRVDLCALLRIESGRQSIESHLEGPGGHSPGVGWREEAVSHWGPTTTRPLKKLLMGGYRVDEHAATLYSGRQFEQIFVGNREIHIQGPLTRVSRDAIEVRARQQLCNILGKVVDAKNEIIRIRVSGQGIHVHAGLFEVDFGKVDLAVTLVVIALEEKLLSYVVANQSGSGEIIGPNYGNGAVAGEKGHLRAFCKTSPSPNGNEKRANVTPLLLPYGRGRRLRVFK